MVCQLGLMSLSDSCTRIVWMGDHLVLGIYCPAPLIVLCRLQGKLMPMLLCYGTLYPTDAFFLALSDEGEDLESLEAPICKLLFKQVCEVLHALHDAGICHGDVRAANFVQRPDGTVCAVDFERAVILDGLSSKQAHAARQSDLQSLNCLSSSSGGYFRG